MKAKVLTLELDQPEQNATLTALNDLRKRRIEDGKSTELIDDIIKRIFASPSRNVKVRHESR